MYSNRLYVRQGSVKAGDPPVKRRSYISLVVLLVAITAVSFFAKSHKGLVKAPEESQSKTSLVDAMKPATASSKHRPGFDPRFLSAGITGATGKNKNTNAVGSPIVAKHFPNAPVIDSREEVLANGDIHRVELVKTKLKYPLIRVESRVQKNPKTGVEKLLFLHEAAADHVVAELLPAKNKSDLEKVIHAVDGKILSQVPLAYAQTFIISLPEAALDSVPQAIAALSQFSDVIKVVDADGVAHLNAAPVIPNDPLFSDMWSLHNIGQDLDGTPDCDIDLPEAWAITTGGSGVMIAISDTGVDVNHKDLQANLWKNDRERAGNGVDEDGNGFVDDVNGWNFVEGDSDMFDDVGHGTHVAGIIGATANNSTGIAGICWNCQMLPVRVLTTNGGFNTDIAAGFDYARQMGARIINASHGGTDSAVMKGAVDDLESAGILLVASAGNEANDNDASPYDSYPASYPNSNIISVGYCGDRDDLSENSNYGATSVDLIAPGILILSSDLDSTYSYWSGSSFAAPHVVGVAGLVLAKNPTWNYFQVRSAILANVDVRPQFAGICAAGGRLNAFKVLASKVPLNTALDATNLVWATGGSAQWIGRDIFSHDGVDMAESGSIWHGQQSWIRTTVTGPGVLKFWWKVSSENGFDLLHFIDGTEKANISGDVGWSFQQFSIDSGSHTLLWRYDKDGGSNDGDDKAWLDQVTFIATGIQMTQPANQSVFAGTNVTFSVTATSPLALVYQWQKNGTNIAGATTTRLNLYNVQAGNAGTYRLRANNGYNTVYSSAATLTLSELSLSPSAFVLPLTGGPTNFTVTETGALGWKAATTNNWLSFTSGTTGTSSKTVSFVASTNLSDAGRLGIISVGNKKAYVTQLGRLAPPSFLKHEFILTITDASGDFPAAGSYLLYANQSSTLSNRFRIVPLTGSTPFDGGTFTYSRSYSSHFELSLTGQTDSSTAGFTFTSRSSGYFKRTSGTNIQHGTFVMQPMRADFNRDGRNDLLLQNTNGAGVAWFMRGTNLYGSTSLRSAGSAKICGVADFLNRGETDLLLQHTDRRISLWLMNNRTNFSREVFLNNGNAVPAGWNICGVGDFNHDNKTDILWQHMDGHAQVWLMNGTNVARTTLLRDGTPASAGWRIVGVCDFNNDGELDILWQNQSSQLSAWLLVGTQFLWSTWVVDDKGTGGWNVVAINDCNDDGYNDLILQSTDRRLMTWFLKNGRLLGKSPVLNNQPVSAALHVAGPR